MKRKMLIGLLLLLLSLFIVIIIGFQDNPNNKDITDVYQISYIHRNDHSDDNQQAIRQGMDQANNVFNIEFVSVPMKTDTDVEEQLQLIQEEIDTGADAILIEPIEDEEVNRQLSKAAKKMPVILVNSKTQQEPKKYVSVSCDNWRLGQIMGEEIGTQNADYLLVLYTNMAFTDVQEQNKGMQKALKPRNTQITMERIQSQEQIEAILTKMVNEKKVKHVVTFDLHILETLGKLKKDHNLFQDIKVYGFGKNNQILSYLEESYVEAIGVANEYSVGYLAVKNAVFQLENKKIPVEQPIEYKLIDGQNMYTTDNQRLLFPFVQ